MSIFSLPFLFLVNVNKRFFVLNSFVRPEGGPSGAEVEEVELPFGIKEVDVIISEWVGHGLFSKNRLASLIFARNKWLAPNGLIFPDRVRLFIGGAEGALWREERYGFWDQV